MACLVLLLSSRDFHAFEPHVRVTEVKFSPPGLIRASSCRQSLTFCKPPMGRAGGAGVLN